MAFSAALGLRNTWVFFASLLVMPFAFQSVTNRAWRLVKALPMLEYATARTSARVYAQIAGSGHADPRLMFRAFLEPAIRDDYPDEALERTSQKPVWVSLFPDTLVIASESREGARLELAHNIFGNFSISADGGEEGDEPLPEDTDHVLGDYSKGFKWGEGASAGGADAAAASVIIFRLVGQHLACRPSQWQQVPRDLRR
jgi:hypothetical protein